MGKHWTLSYTPTATYYSNSKFRDSLDHSTSLIGGFSYADWAVGVVQGYTLTHDTLIETGAQTTLTRYSSSVTVSRRLGDRTLLDMAVSYDATLATGLTSGRLLSTSDWLRYEISSRLDIGVGVAVGRSYVNVGPDSNYTRPQVRIGWNPTERLSLDADAGYEYRKFRTGGSNELVNPVYNASIEYRPLSVTSVFFAAGAFETGSYFAAQATRGVTWNGSVEQRILQKFYFTAGASYREAKYIATEHDFVTGRIDKTRSYNTRLSTVFLRRGSIGIFYQLSKNSSNAAGFDISSRQIGCELGYRF
jgi:hypothetical protein